MLEKKSIQLSFTYGTAGEYIFVYPLARLKNIKIKPREVHYTTANVKTPNRGRVEQ